MNNQITPKDRQCRAIGIKYTEGCVENAQGFLSGGTLRLHWQAGDAKPYVCLDLGPASPGGYPCFRVAAFSGAPLLRCAYADWYDFITDPTYREQGDFHRGSCKYLGPELPVLPANPNRFELYRIVRTGLYTHAYQQGQQRFVLLTLDEPGTVELSEFYIYYTSSLDAYSGYFRSDREDLNYLWDASIYTVQLATIDTSSVLDICRKRLLLRTLTCADAAVVLKPGLSWQDLTLSLEFELLCSPDRVNSFGLLLRADGDGNGCIVRLAADGTLRLLRRQNGAETLLEERQIAPLGENEIHHLEATLSGEELQLQLHGETVSLPLPGTGGSIGFCQMTETCAIVHGYTVTAPDGTPLYRETGESGTGDYRFAAAPAFIADGAKRDRLPWIGDLYWAGENIHYAFGTFAPMRQSVEMFRQHQCPNGFVWGVCYPEDTQTPGALNYGLYQSDIFSAWYIITVDYEYRFDGDRALLQQRYESICADLHYLWCNVDGNGLFYQRYETSKGLWDHALNDYGYFSYNNAIVVEAFCAGARIAAACGLNADAERFAANAQRMRQALLQHFLDADTGMLHNSLEDHTPCYLSTAFALAFGQIPAEYAEKTVGQMCRLQDEQFQMGKAAILFMRGCLRYGYAEVAYRMLTGSTGKIDYLGKCTLNWIDAVQDEKGPACTTECMPYSHTRVANGACWNDSSHPDTGVAFLMSGYLLGVRPLEAGFRRFSFHPQPCGLKTLEGAVPTPYGLIRVSIRLDGDRPAITLSHPHGTQPELQLDDPRLADAQLTVTEEE